MKASMILYGGFLVLIKLFFGYCQDVSMTCPDYDLFVGKQINLICTVSTSYPSKCAFPVHEAEFRVSYDEKSYVPLCKVRDVSQCYFNPHIEGCGCVDRGNTHYTLKYTFIGSVRHNITWDCLINCLDDILNPALTYESKFCRRRNIESIPRKTTVSVPRRPAQYCSDGEFTCTDGRCIKYGRACDGRADCSDGIDEFGCGTQYCSDGQFTCTDGRCIEYDRSCDGRADCSDGIDEFGCESQDVRLTCPEYDLFVGKQINLTCTVSTSYSSKCAAPFHEAEFRVSYDENAYIPLCKVMDVSQCTFNENSEGCGCVKENNTHYTLKYTFIGAVNHNITWDCFINCLDDSLNPALTYESKFCRRRNIESIPRKTTGFLLQRR